MIHQTYQSFPLLSKDFFNGVVHNGSPVYVVKVVDEGTDSNGCQQIHFNFIKFVGRSNELNCYKILSDECWTNQAYSTHLLVLERE